MKFNTKLGRTVAVIAAAGFAVVGLVTSSEAATKPERQALAGPDTVNSAAVINGALGESDMYAPFVASMRSVFNNGVDTSAKIAPGAVDYSDLNAALKAKIDAPGTPGADAILSVTADTMVTDRPDTATDGSVWAKDSMTRTLTVVRQHATKASDCGSGAVKCWYYTGTIRDNGTFKTQPGAHGPNSTTPISGIVNGTVNGVYEIEFYATSDKPNPSLVDSTVTGASPSTGDWMKQAFPAGTSFNGFTGVDYKWVYAAPATCEVHTQATSGNTGDILGANAC